MKITILTAVFNGIDTISDSIYSVQQQSHTNIEHILLDGKSTDGTVDFLEKNKSSNTILISEPDLGIYHALNKGLALATGDVIGIMHADDFYADKEVLKDVAQAFSNPAIDLVYGDLNYVARKDPNKIIRNWASGSFAKKKLSWGWMPPHPTLFIRKEILEKLGGYDTRFSIAADYDFILRYFSQPQITTHYIPRVLTKMRLGGMSNQSMRKIFLKSNEDFLVIKKNKVGGIRTLLMKNLRKLHQFIYR